MSLSVNVLAIHALEELKGALARFGGEAREALEAAEREIRRTLEWLEERHAHWQREVRRRQEDVRRAQAALERCRASARYDPQTGRHHVLDCSRYERVLREAQSRLREAEAELKNVREWSRQVQQAVVDYQRQAQRLATILNDDLPKATALLGRKSAHLHRYTMMTAPSGGEGAIQGERPSVSNSDSEPGISWAEQRAVWERVDAGETITPDELRRLQQPASDLQTGTLAEDEAWVQQLLESERYREAMRDSQEAETLQEALLALLKAINYWRSKS